MIREEDIQALAWKPQTPELGRVLPMLAAEAERNRPERMESTKTVSLVEIEQANGTAFFGAVPHTDRDFDRWFIMLIVQTPGDVVLHTARRKSVVENPKAAVSVPLVEGEILLFDAHRLHWVEPPAGLPRSPAQDRNGFDLHEKLMKKHRSKMSVIVGTETTERPTKEQAEALLCQYLRDHTPRCWAAANPTPRRRRLGL